MTCFMMRRLGPWLRFSLIDPLSYHSIQPRSSSSLVRTTIIGVFAAICLR